MSKILVFDAEAYLVDPLGLNQVILLKISRFD
jgi:hypothetical protein